MEKNTKEESGGLIFKKMPKILKGVEAIAKLRKNDQQGYRFRGIDDILNEVHPLFAEHEVFMTARITKETREERKNHKGNALLYTILHVAFKFHATDGSNVETEAVGEAMDSGDKASNKSQSAALKYALITALLIPTEEKETEDEDHRPAPREDRGRDEEAPERPSRREREEEADRPEPAPAPRASTKKAAPVSSKPSPTDPEWRDVVWHHQRFGKVPANAKRNANSPYLNETLGWVLLNDPTGLAYYIKNFADELATEGLKGDDKDARLVRAFAAAKAELGDMAESEEAGQAQAASEGSQAEPEPEPEGGITDEVNELVTELRVNLMDLKRNEPWLLGLLKKFKHCAPDTAELINVPLDKLKKTKSAWAYFKKQASEEGAA